MLVKFRRRHAILLFLAAITAPSLNLYAASAQIFNPISVKVSKGTVDGKIVYSYQVTNASQDSVVSLEIGFNDANGEPELTAPPSGWDYFQGTPSESIKSPPYWQSAVIATEERGSFSIFWEPTAEMYALPPNRSLSGFFVYVPQTDNSYTTGHWRVILDSAIAYSGSFKVR